MQMYSVHHHFISLVMTCLRSAPNAKAQQFLHVDYSLETQNKNPGEQPVSAMIAIEAFTIDIVANKKKEKLRKVTFDPGDMIIFTNKCIHRGGANTSKKDARRVFFYCAHSIADINGRAVQLYGWETHTKQYDAIDPPEEEEKSVSLKRKRQRGKLSIKIVELSSIDGIRIIVDIYF